MDKISKPSLEQMEQAVSNSRRNLIGNLSYSYSSTANPPYIRSVNNAFILAVQLELGGTIEEYDDLEYYINFYSL